MEAFPGGEALQKPQQREGAEEIAAIETVAQMSALGEDWQRNRNHVPRGSTVHCRALNPHGPTCLTGYHLVPRCDAQRRQCTRVSISHCSPAKNCGNNRMSLELHCLTHRRPARLIERSSGNETRNPGRRRKEGWTLIGSCGNQGIQSRCLVRFKRNKRKREQLFQGAPEALPFLTQRRWPKSDPFSFQALSHKTWNAGRFIVWRSQ